MASNTYSFKDVNASISGPNGQFVMGNGAGPSDEGITISQSDDVSSLLTGADGSGMHSLHAGRSGTVTARFLKTSPVNALLMDMCNADRESGSVFGQNIIMIRDASRGDVISCTGCGFKKVPDLSYAKDGGMVEWTWNAISIDYKLGNGSPAVL